MITLNLIPREQKNTLKNSRLYAAFKEAVTLILLFTAISSIMLWVSRYYLEQELADLMNINAINIKSNQATNDQIIAINNKIKATENIQNNFVPLGQFTARVAAMIPENIALNSLRLYRQESTLELIGTAKTRANLLQFKNSLEKNSWIKNVNLPITDLIDRENNKFIIKLELNTTSAFLPL
jgi:Tfp pilus assembly protein PilN